MSDFLLDWMIFKNFVCVTRIVLSTSFCLCFPFEKAHGSFRRPGVEGGVRDVMPHGSTHDAPLPPRAWGAGAGARCVLAGDSSQCAASRV